MIKRKTTKNSPFERFAIVKTIAFSLSLILIEPPNNPFNLFTNVNSLILKVIAR